MSSAVPAISPIELKALMASPGHVQLIDVREAYEREICVLSPDLHLPLEDLAARKEELDPELEIVVYCRSGSRSALATQYLLRSGFQRVRNLEGGILAWRREIDPSLRAY